MCLVEYYASIKMLDTYRHRRCYNVSFSVGGDDGTECANTVPFSFFKKHVCMYVWEGIEHNVCTLLDYGVTLPS